MQCSIGNYKINIIPMLLVFKQNPKWLHHNITIILQGKLKMISSYRQYYKSVCVIQGRPKNKFFFTVCST